MKVIVNISNFWGRFAGSTLSELVELFGDKIQLPDVPPLRQIRKGQKVRKEYESRNRIFNQWRTFWLFLSQVFNQGEENHTCSKALKKAQAWLAIGESKTISSNTSAYCQSRNRLNPLYLDKINREVVKQIEPQIPLKCLWYGRHVKVVDGSSVSMPDTERNQRLYPQPSGQKKGCGFPVMRITVIFSLVTGIILACRKGSLHIHERTLWHEMWDCYQENDVVLADCGFCSFADYYLLKEKGVDCVMRLHQRRKEKIIIKKFNSKDYLVRWEKGTRHQKPNWMTLEQWRQLPETMIVRHLKVFVDIPGFRTKNFTLATTLLDPKAYPYQALADLYRRRWMAELFLRDAKITMGMRVLRSKTPEMIHKELSIFMTAYNLIRSFIWELALKKGIDPYRISFKGAIASILERTPFLATAKNSKEKKQTLEYLMNAIATDLIPIRNNLRWEPRAIKRRPNPTYQLLTKNRHEFIELAHKHHHRKCLAQPENGGITMQNT